MKNRKRCSFLAVLAVLVGLSGFVYAQGADSAVQPSPTRIKAAQTKGRIVLTWLDAPNFQGDYLVFKSDEAITAGSLASAIRLGDLIAGSQTFTYTPTDDKPYFYGVFASTAEGSPYPVFVPEQNVLAAPIALAKELPPPPAAAAPAVAAPSANPAPAKPAPAPASAPPSATPNSAPAQPLVSDISAKAKGDSIVISYKAAPQSRLVLYRGAMMISTAADLLDATLVAAFTDKDGSFADYPVPGVDYFYAILGEDDLKAGKIIITLGVNSLKRSVQVHAGAIASGLGEIPPPSRTPPLPYFLLENGGAGDAALMEHDGLVPEQAVSPETEKAIASLLSLAPAIRPTPPAMRVLPEELAPPSGGEDYALSIIVNDRIAAKDWPTATDQLKKYLSLNRSPKAAARAHYYLGEALASMGSDREAFFEFLSAQQFYPAETKSWVDYVLSVLRETDQG